MQFVSSYEVVSSTGETDIILATGMGCELPGYPIDLEDLTPITRERMDDRSGAIH